MTSAALPPHLTSSSVRTGVVVITTIGAVALAFRLSVIVALPTLPASDEVGYLQDGLLLLEGLPLGYKFAPSAAITWLVTLFAGLQTAVVWLFGTADPSTPPLLRPLAAMDRVLFTHYADLTSMRWFVLAAQLVVGSVAAAGTAWSGYRAAGVSGAVAAGLLAAGLPVFVEFGAQARPYSFAWSLALLSFAAVFTLEGRAKVIVGGTLIGLAMATRIDMATCLPILVLEVAFAHPTRRLRAAAVFIGVATLGFCVAAPWYVTSLAGNLRQILDIRFLLAPETRLGPAQVILSMFKAGIGLPLFAVLLALGISGVARRKWQHFAYAGWVGLLTALALRQSVGGVRHDGALFVLVVALSPLALSAMLTCLPAPRVNQLAVWLAACLFGLSALAIGIPATELYRQQVIPGSVVEWLEKHVPAGTTIYLTDTFAVPLPTEESAEALWAEVTRPDAWHAKFARAARRLNLRGDRLPPRAMSEDPMQFERALRRRWFILGAPLAVSRPRYDIRIVGVGSAFSVPLETAIDRLCKEGGAYIHTGLPIDRLGPPKIDWRSPDGQVLSVYAIEPASSANSAPRC